MPCDGVKIQEYVDNMIQLQNAGKQISRAATIVSVLVDGGLAGAFVECLINSVIGSLVGNAIVNAFVGLAIIAEYSQRVGTWRAINLKNRCSECQLKGHNKSNCPALNGSKASCKAFTGFVSLPSITAALE